MAKSDISVFLRLVGQRKFAAELGAAGAELEAMGLKGAKAMSVFAAQGEKLKKLGRSWTRNVSLPIVGVGVAAVGFAVNFDRAMRNVNSIAQLPERQFHQLERSVLALAGPTAQSPKTLAEGLYDLVSSGFNAKEAMMVLGSSARAASAGLTTTEVSTQAIAAALNSYHLPASKAKEVSDILFETVNRGVISFDELASQLGYIVSTGNAAGIGLKELGAEVSTLTLAGQVNGQAITNLNQAITAFLKPSKDMKKAVRALGYENAETLLKTKGFQGAVEALANHAGGSKEELASYFGNVRAGRAVYALTGKGAKVAQENIAGFNNVAGSTNKVLKEQEKSVGFKAQRAWAKLQATLIKLGYKVLPVLLPAAEKLVNIVGSVLDKFIALPGPVQASIAGFLLFTGPVLTGLGYFAGGIGRILILTTKLVKAGEALAIFGTAMKAGQGLGGSASIAFAGAGSAALQTAKGFAYSLGPALAAYGIGNIVTSALNKDWRDAGFEAGGAIAGGIAGFMVGGPLGAMLGVGIGSLGGELLSGLFEGTPKVDRLKVQTEHLTRAMGLYRRTLGGVKAGERLLARTQQQSREASKKYRKAKHNETQALIKFGAGSWRAHRAQLALARAERGVTRAARAQAHAHRLSGNRLKLYRLRSLEAVASIKQSIPTLKHRIGALNRENNAGRLSTEGLERLVKMEGRLRATKTQLTAAYAKAENLAGKPWAHRLASLTNLQAEYGRKGHTLIEAQEKARSKMKELTDVGLRQSTMWEEAREELSKYVHLSERFSELEEGLSPSRLGGSPRTRTNQGEHGHRPPGSPRRTPPNRHRGAAHARAATSSALFSPAATRLSLEGDRVIAIEVTNHNNLHLDGKKVAENTTRQSQKAANRS